MRRRKHIEVVGLSFLDMICCAFGGIVVLYAVTPRTEAVGSPFRNSTELAIELAAGAPFDVGMAFTVDGIRVECWTEPCSSGPGLSVSWLRSGGEIRALVQGTSSPAEDIRVAIVGGSAVVNIVCVTAFARTAGSEVTFRLPIQDAFRARVDFARGGVQC